MHVLNKVRFGLILNLKIIFDQEKVIFCKISVFNYHFEICYESCKNIVKTLKY